MNKFVKGLCVACVGAFVCAFGGLTNAHAAPVLINDDTYVGGLPVKRANPDNIPKPSYGVDVIGNDALYDTTNAIVDRVDGNSLSVKIFSNYVDNVGSHGTYLGALFIGAATPQIQNTISDPITNVSDTYVGDETRFKYALDFDSNDPSNTDSSTNIVDLSASLYQLADGTGGTVAGEDVNVSNVPLGYIYREKQAVDTNESTRSNSIGAGTWSLDATQGDGNNYIEFVIADFFGPNSVVDNNIQQNFVFAWTMSCANDVFMGVVNTAGLTNPVPLPAGFVLLLTGLLGVGWLGRSRARQA